MTSGGEEFDPHVLSALICVLFAVMVVFGLYIVNLAEKEEAKKKRRNPFEKKDD